ncbi:Poly [ADP-ribose] polymerase 3 [Armadillidium nasatum]|uniref:Poly [ADP-ribose] polymerase n=1 Tax=Armadillidium nasatum TaxID=96803 RepID=A0A5N5SZ70_9CRUS|nr:Poly [ADP-ribose] polymerase 3 [Armadillidium nasatum]
MPPKKRGSSKIKTKSGTKTGRKKRGNVNDLSDDEPPPKLVKEESFRTKLQNIIDEEEEKEKNISKTFKPDPLLVSTYGDNIAIHEDYSTMLNQTNIGNNNNKFYVIQIGKEKSKLYFIHKMGSSESGLHKCESFAKVEDAINQFKKKFKEKTKNEWEKRENFVPSKGKYTLIEICQESHLTSKLDPRTQLMIKLIFNDDMFRDQMENMNLDVRKMPLGKLSKSQILKGLNILLELEKEIKKTNKSNAKMVELSSQFYTFIPHNFGRKTPPVICTEDVVDKKKEMMMTLTDIEIAQSLLKKDDQAEENMNPIDAQYKKLECDLERIDNNSEEFKTILEYATACNDAGKNILDIWKVNRHSEGKRFALHDDISFRKLLWHGTNVAVVAAILKDVGFHYGAFEEEKDIGFMFLTEVALGKMKFITNVDWSLTSAPDGYDSIVARGHTEPDPKKDKKWTIEDHEVIIPVGKPILQKKFKESQFTQSEYLVYKESQARIRYIIKFSR